MARGQNIVSKVFNKPQLITLEGLQPIVDYLADPQRSALLKLAKQEESKPLLRADFNSDEAYQKRRLSSIGINPNTMVATLEIKDTLVNREGQLNADCMELTSYEGLKKTFKAQVDEGISHCVLMVDSSGGEAYGCFEAANYVQKLAKENSVKLTAYVDGLSASAAFAWTAIADEVIANPMSQIGSVGVVVQLYNNSRMLKEIGIDRSFVFAGGNKIPFNADGDFTEKFINDLQESVNKSYEKFVNHVATHRNMSVQAVKDTQASVYDADVALTIGFVDKLMEVEDFENYLSMNSSNNTVYFNNTVEQSTTLKHNKETQTMSEQNVQEQVASVEELTAQLATATIDKQSLETQVAKLQGDLSKVQSDLSASVLAKEHAEAELTKFKADAAHNARVEQLANVFGADSEKPQMYATMFASLDAEAFGKVVSDFQASVKTQEQSMEEVGHSASASAIAETPEEMLLKQAQARKAKQKA